ncbi:hypothetical protein BGX28_000917 [Mortierella sp. GBA30]|nr:hypothetical protein BGX28_000917 [Mortierella sp. GBA30]
MSSSSSDNPQSSPAVAVRLDHVLDTNDPTVRALIQAAVAHQQQQDAAAAAAVAAAAGMIKNETATTSATASSTPSLTTVPVEILQSLLPGVTSTALSASASALSTISTATTVTSSSVAAPAPILTVAPTTQAATTESRSAAATSSRSSKAPSPPSRTPAKRFNPDDIFCLGCCRNLSVDHYTCPTTNRVFKSCNACRQKSRTNSKKVVKPISVPTKPTISMEEFGAKLRELEATEEESSLDVMVRLEGSVEMDQETLKARGAQIAAQVYESTGYWFSHSRTNDETQSKTRLKIYGCSQREDRRAPPAPKTQSRKRNRPSTKAYFPCKGNLTMTFYHNMNHVRVVYGHKRHAKYDNRKCPDHVRAYVKENLGLPPRQIYDNLIERDSSLGITQAQVRYWSHYYKRNGGQDGNDHNIKDGNDVHNDHDDNDEDPTSSKGSPSLQQQQKMAEQQAEEERLQHEQVQQLLLASNAAALQSLAQSHHHHHHHHHQVSQGGLVGGPIAISVPMSDMDTTPLSSSIVQRVLAEDGGKGLLQLQASLNAVASAASSASVSASSSSTTTTARTTTENVGGDAVVQQVSDFMKENDQHQVLTTQQQQQQS